MTLFWSCALAAAGAELIAWRIVRAREWALTVEAERRRALMARQYETFLEVERRMREAPILYGQMTHPAVQASSDAEAADRLLIECGYRDDGPRRSRA